MSLDYKLGKKNRKYWSDEETQILKIAVNKYGKKWSIINKMYPIFKKNGRTQVDLKDKWRNIEGRNKSRKIKDAGEIDGSDLEEIKRIAKSRPRKSRKPKRSIKRSIKRSRKSKSRKLKRSMKSRKAKSVKISDFTIYSKSGCPSCQNAKDLFKNKKIKFKEIKVTDKNIENIYKKIDKKTNNYRYFPIIFKKNKFIGGFAELEKMNI